MKKYLKPIIILIFLLSLYIFISAYTYVYAISNNLSNNVFRLHVIANSDTVEDQNLKYKVRDNLLEYMNKLCSNISKKEDAINIAKTHLADFTKIAEDTIKKEGFSYKVNVEIGNFEFPTKTYGDVAFPAGYYDALKVKIGEASGQNWWCVMFPPLCFVDTSTGIIPSESKENLKENLSDEEYQIISDTENSSYTVKFKLIEFFEKSGLITAKNN